jgi:hypothetical protein
MKKNINGFDDPSIAVPGLRIQEGKYAAIFNFRTL